VSLGKFSFLHFLFWKVLGGEISPCWNLVIMLLDLILLGMKQVPSGCMWGQLPLARMWGLQDWSNPKQRVQTAKAFWVNEKWAHLFTGSVEVVYGVWNTMANGSGGLFSMGCSACRLLGKLRVPGNTGNCIYITWSWRTVLPSFHCLR
jgi:hypothetical protein